MASSNPSASPSLSLCSQQSPLAPTTQSADSDALEWSRAPKKWASRGEPFYEHNTKYPQRLAQIECPDATFAEYVQGCTKRRIRMPAGLRRDGAAAEIKAWMPAPRMPAPRPGSQQALAATDEVANFHHLWHGYMSGRRVVCPEQADDGRALLRQEREELEAFCARTDPLDNSLPPRGVALLLVLPPTSTASTLSLLDGFATLADTPPNSNKLFVATPPLTMCSKVRFSVHGGVLAAQAASILEEESCDSQAWNAVKSHAPFIVLRWCKLGLDGDDVRVRAERVEVTAKDLADCGVNGTRAAEVLRKLALRLAEAYDVPMPAQLDAKLPATAPNYFEKHIVDAGQELYQMMYQEETFCPTEQMSKCGVTRLADVYGVYVRIVRNDLSQSTSKSSLYGHLLCAGGDDQHQWAHTMDAKNWACHNYLGLPPVNDRSPMMQRMLHTLAATTFPIELGERVSLYGLGGKSGQPIQSPNSWIWASRIAIVPVQQSQKENFFILTCDWRSCKPKDERFKLANDAYMERLHDYMQRFCPLPGGKVVPRPVVAPQCPRPLAAPQTETAEDALALQVFAPPGLQRISSYRNYLDDAIVGMHAGNVPKPIVQMLREARLFLPDDPAPTLVDACRLIHKRLRGDRELEEARKLEMDRLNDLASSAVIDGAAAATAAAGGCGVLKRSRTSVEPGGYKPDAVKELIAALKPSMVVARPSFGYEGMHRTPRGMALPMATLIATAYNGGQAPAPEKITVQMIAAAKTIEDPLVAFLTVAKLCNTAGVRTFFSVITEAEDSVSVGELCMRTGTLVPCDRFAVFSATPRVYVAVRMKSNNGMVVNALSSRPQTNGKPKA